MVFFLDYPAVTGETKSDSNAHARYRGATVLDFPFYIYVGSWAIHPHFVLETMAYAIGFWVYRRLRRRLPDPVDEAGRWTVIAAAAVGAALGSKVLFWFEDPALLQEHWRNPLYWMAGKTIVGGLLGAWAAVELTKWRMGITRSTGDLFAFPLCVGIAIGRMGCFLTGLSDKTYGVATGFPWGVDFGDGIARHPTQLYEILFVSLLGGLLLWRMKQPHRNGDLFKTFMAGYMAWRLLVDFIKPGTPLLGMTTLQWAALLAVTLYWRDIPRLLGRGWKDASGSSLKPAEGGG